MGLDLVELVMDVEKTFGISLPDARLSKMSTVGELHDCIVEILDRKEGDAALRESMFDRLRQAVQSVRGTVDNEIRLDTRLDELFPVGRRRRGMRKLARLLDMPPPPLHRPRAVKIAAIIAAVILGVITSLHAVGAFQLWQMIAVASVPGSWGMFVAAALFWGFIGYWLTKPAAVLWPQDLHTMSDLTQFLVAAQYGAIVKHEKDRSSEEIWGILQRIVVDNLRVDIQLVTPEARFIQDLGAD